MQFGPPQGYQVGHHHDGLKQGACREFSATGRCKYGSNCKFAHDLRPAGQQQQLPPQQDGRPGAALLKTKMCPNFQRGNCRFGSNCKFAHGEHQLQDHRAFNQASQSLEHLQQQQQPPQPGLPGGFQQQQQFQAGMPAGFQQQHPQPMQPLQHLQHPMSDIEQQQSMSRQHSGQAALPGPPRQQQQQQQQQQQRQQPAIVRQAPQRSGGGAYVDRVRAICLALNIGNPGDVVTPEAMEAAGRSFQQRTCFRENPFADSIDKYLQQA